MEYAKYIGDIVSIVESNENLVQHDYNSKKDQILLLKELVSMILTYINKLKNIKITSKKLLDLAIREAFKLSKSDLIINKNGYILLKLIDESKIKKISQKDKNTIANRYAGIDEKELKSFYDEFIADTAYKNLFLLIAKEFINKYFHKRKITNIIYEKNVFRYIQTIIFEHLCTIYDNDDGFFNGFAGYIFRIHFKEVFENIADMLLDELSISNDYIIEFLTYYTSDIMVINGNKYKIPHIVSEDGLRWTVVSMMSVAKIYTKARRSIIEHEKEVLLLGNSIKKLYLGSQSPIAYHAAYLKSKQSLEQNLNNLKRRLEREQSLLNLSKGEMASKRIEVKIREIKISLNKEVKEIDALSKKELNNSVIVKYKELQALLDSKSKKLIIDKRVIMQNKQQYFSIRESLVKALIAKKKKI